MKIRHLKRKFGGVIDSVWPPRWTFSTHPRGGAGEPVRAMVQDLARAADLERAGAQLAVADFDRPDTLAGALAGVERSLLLSAVDLRAAGIGIKRQAEYQRKMSTLLGRGGS